MNKIKDLDMNMPELIDLLCSMLKYDTTNPPGNEKPLAIMLQNLLNTHGFSTELVDLGHNRANLTATLKGNGTGPALLLNGHLDVVPVGQVSWNYPPFEHIIEDGKIYGRGTADMKGGLAAMISAALTIKNLAQSFKGDLILSFSADEESGSLGARDFVDKGGLQGVGAIIIGEPSSCELNISEKGALWLTITVQGKTAHGAFPEQGINAIIGMNAIITEILQYKPDYTPNSLLSQPTINISTIQGGVKTNVVPDQCVLTLDIRTVPGMDHQILISELNSIAQKTAQAMPGLQVSLSPQNDRPAVETISDHPFVQLAQTVIQDNFGRTSIPKGVSFYTDAAIFLPNTQLPAILYGPGDAAMAHQPNEYVSIAHLEEAAIFYAQMIARYLL